MAGRNKIENVSFLAELPNLSSLWLEHNNIYDVKQFENMNQLEQLNLSGNPITEVQIIWLKTKLPNCEIIFNDSDYDYEINLDKYDIPL